MNTVCLSLYRLSAACQYCDFRKYTRIAMQSICIIEVYCGIFSIGTEVCSTYSSFTGNSKEYCYITEKSFADFFMMLHFFKHTEIDMNHQGTLQDAYYIIWFSNDTTLNEIQI